MWGQILGDTSNWVALCMCTRRSSDPIPPHAQHRTHPCFALCSLHVQGAPDNSEVGRVREGVEEGGCDAIGAGARKLRGWHAKDYLMRGSEEIALVYQMFHLWKTDKC